MNFSSMKPVTGGFVNSFSSTNLKDMQGDEKYRFGRNQIVKRGHPTWPIVSVIILNYNGKEFLNKCLDSVFETDYPNYDVILVDNASNDGSVELVQKDFSQKSNFRLILNSRNLGFAEGNNIGVKAAKGKYVVFLNNDTEVDQEWLKELVVVMEADKTIGAAQSKLLFYDRKSLDSAGDFISYFGRGWMRGHGEKDEGQYDIVSEIFSARGAAMAIRRQVFDNVGCFDPEFFTICEDIDLCWRLRLNGYKVVFVPKSIVYHFGSGTITKTQKLIESNYYYIRNGLIMLIKNYNLKNLLITMIVSVYTVVLELGIFLMFLPLTPKKLNNLCRFYALLWILFNFKYIWKKRLYVQSTIRKVPDSLVKKAMIKCSPFLGVVWQLLYTNKVDYDRFLNEQILLKNQLARALNE